MICSCRVVKYMTVHAHSTNRTQNSFQLIEHTNIPSYFFTISLYLAYMHILQKPHQSMSNISNNRTPPGTVTSRSNSVLRLSNLLMLYFILSLIIYKPTNLHRLVCCIAERTALDKLEKTSQTVNGASSIIGDSAVLSTILSPIKNWLRNPPSSPRQICSLCFYI